MIKELELLIKAKANVIEMVSYEDKRIQGFVNQVAKSLSMNWYVWNEVNGLQRFDSRNKKFEKEEDIADYLDILNFFTNSLEDNTILVLQDFHQILNRQDPHWINKRSHSFSQEAKEFGVETPKGIMLLGVPGCGKSLTAKAVAKSWNYPLLRFDIGKVFGGIVGESEQNVRKALDIAKAIAPCVLWIDEIEKGLSGVQSSGQTDGGTTSRVFGTLLTWMQEKTEPVFVIATANNIKELPPELMRKGRFDEVFFVDLPSIEERKKIFQIHISSRKRAIEKFNLEELSKATKGFSGSEIEECVKEGLQTAFSENRDIEENDIINAAKQTVPLSITMGEGLRKLREWAKFRARQASTGNVEEIDMDRSKVIPKLKSEVCNPFID